MYLLWVITYLHRNIDKYLQCSVVNYYSFQLLSWFTENWLILRKYPLHFLKTVLLNSLCFKILWFPQNHFHKVVQISILKIQTWNPLNLEFQIDLVPFSSGLPQFSDTQSEQKTSGCSYDIQAHSYVSKNFIGINSNI